MKRLIVGFMLVPLLLLGQEKSIAPDFMLENLDGDLVELGDLTGDGPLLISFWATWCKPCHEEMVELNKIYNELQDQGMQFVAISTDNEKSVAKVKPFIRSNDYRFEVLYDTNSEVARKYYAQMMPFTVIVNKQGEIVYSHMGYKKGDEIKIRELIGSLL